MCIITILLKANDEMIYLLPSIFPNCTYTLFVILLVAIMRTFASAEQHHYMLHKERRPQSRVRHAVP